MNIADTYNDIAGKLELPKMRDGGYKADPRTITDPNTLWDQLRALNPQQGWLLFQSHQCEFKDGLPPPPLEPAHGTLLAAEAITKDGLTSIALDQNGRGGWTLTTYALSDSGDWLYDEPQQLQYSSRSDSDACYLQYRRYWAHSDEHGYRQEVACFVGFTDKEAQS